jgi:hypothetical protein
MKTETAVLEFAYMYKGDVFGVDIGLDDKKYQKGLPDVMHKYYMSDWYSIFKSYGKRLRPEYLPEYKAIQEKIELYVAVRYQLEMLVTLDAAGVDAPKVTEALNKSSDKYLSQMGITTRDPHEAIAALTQLVQDEVLVMIPEFARVLEPQHVRKIGYNIWRGAEGRKQMDKDGPLFSTSPADFSVLSWLSIRASIPLDEIIDCYLQTSEKAGQTVREVIKETIVDNAFSIRSDGKKLALYDGEVLVREYPKSVMSSSVLAGR